MRHVRRVLLPRKEIIVVGGGDSAMEEANFRTRFASKVTLVHRREEFRASKIMLDRARANPKISFVLNREPVAYEGEPESGGLTGLRVRNTKTGELEVIEAKGCFLAIGHVPNTGLLGGALETDEKGYLKTVPGSSRTKIPGVFACGDVQDSYYRQAVTAAGRGAWPRSTRSDSSRPKATDRTPAMSMLDTLIARSVPLLPKFVVRRVASRYVAAKRSTKPSRSSVG
jgi:thioredoxin reductase